MGRWAETGERGKEVRGKPSERRELSKAEENQGKAGSKIS